MGEQQTASWEEAQRIEVSVPLLPAAQQLLEFLQCVHNNHPCLLYSGPALQRAIHRYQHCWLPLLANFHDTNGFPTLLPPLDCAWIWHCHRLNPVQYHKDCESLYGRLLDAPPILFDPNLLRSATDTTQQIWNETFPTENYHLDLTLFPFDMALGQPLGASPPDFYTFQQLGIAEGSSTTKRITYNLEEAVARQRPFFYQVSQPHMRDQRFLQAAEQRYKAFLHLFKITQSAVFLVPTYDIDLMWHAHQLSPVCYRQDMLHILGKVLDHDDTDSDRTAGHKLDDGFNTTRDVWQSVFGTLYDRAGAMYRGEPPAPVLPPALPATVEVAVGTPVVGMEQNSRLTSRQLMQVSVIVLEAKNVPTKTKGTLRVRLEFKSKCSALRVETVDVPLASDPRWNHHSSFQCETSTRGLKLGLLLRRSNSFKQSLLGSKFMGRMELEWQRVLAMPTLSCDGWYPLFRDSQASDDSTEPPPLLRISVSVTPPQPGPHLLRIINSPPTDKRGRMHSSPSGYHGFWLTRTVLDHANRDIFIIRTSYSGASRFRKLKSRIKQMYIHQGGWEYHSQFSDRGTAPANIVAGAEQLEELDDMKVGPNVRRQWILLDNPAQVLTVSKDATDPLWNMRPGLELNGNFGDPIKLVCGRKLDYEVKGANNEEEGGFVTVIRYNPKDAPLGKATALFNWRSGAMEVLPQESVLLVLLVSNIIAMSVFDIEGSKVKLNSNRRLPSRSSQSYDEWGAVVFEKRNSTSLSRSMIPYYCWWDMPSIVWISTFYTPDNVLFGGSGCGAAGACGASACGASACGGSGCG